VRLPIRPTNDELEFQNFSMTRNLFLPLFCAVFLFLTGCSRLDFAFRWADTYITSKVDDYFDISSQQSKELKNDLKKDLQAFRKEILPSWRDRLKTIQGEIDQGLFNSDRQSFYFNSFAKEFDHINSHFAETATDFITTINNQQIKYFAQALQKKNSEELKKFSDEKKLKTEYRDKYVEYFEMFIGSLNAEQKQLVEESLTSSPFPAILKIKNKNFVFQEFAAQSDSTEKMKNFVQQYFAHPEKYDMPEYRQALEQYQQNLQQLVVKVLGTLTPKQKSALKENIFEKIQQLQKIISQS